MSVRRACRLTADFTIPLFSFFVFGGSLMCTLMRNSFMEFLGMFGTFIKFIYYSQPKPLELVREIVELANVNRRDGPIAMQNVEIKNKFLQKAVNMVVDWY